MGPDEILEVVRQTNLPEGWGFACFDRPGGPCHGHLIITLGGEETYSVFLCAARQGTEHRTEVTIDRDGTPEEFAKAIGAAEIALRAYLAEVQPWVS